jgi:hypothetical protein
MVFARTPEAEQNLIKQFSKHTVHRVYQAIALGRVEARTIESFLVRDRGDGLRGSTAKPDEGQRAVTHVRPIENLEGYTVVECQLETGRTHQIRIHLSEAGHMLCGERMYDQVLVEKRKVADPSGAPRVALHARELGFVHPRTGEELSFKSPWPKDLEMLLQRLRQGENSLTKMKPGALPLDPARTRVLDLCLSCRLESRRFLIDCRGSVPLRDEEQFLVSDRGVGWGGCWWRYRRE